MFGKGFNGVYIAETGITHCAASDLVPGNTFHGILTASCVSNSRNSVIFTAVAPGECRWFVDRISGKWWHWPAQEGL